MRETKYAWMEEAACKGLTHLFYLEAGSPGESSPALSICQSCPVRSECLDKAVKENETFGVWGGLTPTQRRRGPRAAYLLEHPTYRCKSQRVKASE